MEEGTVRSWYKQVGDRVAVDELLGEVETDKITNELPAPAAGIVARILVQADETVDVGTVLCLLAETEEEAAALAA
jgi:pyruvate/2-oxoglutarate dehydrogenase complex dihydrolipoamide acyltransferase (E2) component